MFLSDRDIKFALQNQQLIVIPPPAKIDTCSFDVHLDKIEQAKVWNVKKYEEMQSQCGGDRYLGVGSPTYSHQKFHDEYGMPIPVKRDVKDVAPKALVYVDGEKVVVEPGGFFLWQTKEAIGTPEIDPRFICFINGKSTRARAGLLVHMTAPTIEAGWWGNVVLEICNLGPFVLSLKEDDRIAQITVAAISCFPEKKKDDTGIAIGQSSVGGRK